MADIIINTIPIHKTIFIFLLCGSYNFSRRIAGVGSASEESSEAGLQNGAVLSTLILFFSEKIDISECMQIVYFKYIVF